MVTLYNDRTGLLRVRLNDIKQKVRNLRVSEEIIVDMGENKIIGIEILDALKHVDLEKLLPIRCNILKNIIKRGKLHQSE